MVTFCQKFSFACRLSVRVCVCGVCVCVRVFASVLVSVSVCGWLWGVDIEIFASGADSACYRVSRLNSSIVSHRLRNMNAVVPNPRIQLACAKNLQPPNKLRSADKLQPRQATLGPTRAHSSQNEQCDHASLS